MHMKKQSVPQTKVSTAAIILAVIASFIVSIVLYVGLAWLTGDYDTQSTKTYASDEPSVGELAVILAVFAFVLLSPVVAAVIVWLKIRKKH